MQPRIARQPRDPPIAVWMNAACRKIWRHVDANAGRAPAPPAPSTPLVACSVFAPGNSPPPSSGVAPSTGASRSASVPTPGHRGHLADRDQLAVTVSSGTPASWAGVWIRGCSSSRCAGVSVKPSAPTADPVVKPSSPASTGQRPAISSSSDPAGPHPRQVALDMICRGVTPRSRRSRPGHVIGWA